VVAFGFDERTVAQWQARAGEHCQEVHRHLVEQGQVELGQVQADELWVKRVGKRLWMAMALAVPSRLWLGGVISPRRNRAWITELVQEVRAYGRNLAIRVCVDGLASYVTAFLRIFRHKVATGRRGRPRLVVEPGLLIGQVIKHYARRCVVKVVHRVVRGTATAIAKGLRATGGTVINTASIERLHATFGSALAPLARRGRALAHTEAVLTAGRYSLGCTFNFCWSHDSLRLVAPQNTPRKWQERTPAMAAGLTNHRWTLHELLLLKVPCPLGLHPNAKHVHPS
jgi:transposase-like protein